MKAKTLSLLRNSELYKDTIYTLYLSVNNTNFDVCKSVFLLFNMMFLTVMLTILTCTLVEWQKLQPMVLLLVPCSPASLGTSLGISKMATDTGMREVELRDFPKVRNFNYS